MDRPADRQRRKVLRKALHAVARYIKTPTKKSRGDADWGLAMIGEFSGGLVIGLNEGDEIEWLATKKRFDLL